MQDRKQKQPERQPQASSSNTRVHVTPQDEAHYRAFAAALHKNNARVLEETKKMLNERTSSNNSTISYRSELSPLTFKDIVGIVPEQIHTIVRALQNQKLYHHLGLRELPNKLLLYGPPGTGKTSLARAIAGETHRAFFFASAGDLINSYQGSGAQSIIRLFEEARQAGPAVVFIDEIDGIADTNTRDASGECKRMLYQLFKQLEDCKSILFVAATNFKDKLPEALNSRFSGCSVEIPLPDEHTRKLLFLNFMPHSIPTVSDAFFNTLARESQGLSGRDIKNIVDYAINVAFMRITTQQSSQTDVQAAEADKITEDDLYKALYYQTNLLPNAHKRKIILQSYTQDYNVPDTLIHELVLNTENFTGKQLHALIEEAKRNAQNSMPTQEDFYRALYNTTELLPNITIRKLLLAHYKPDLLQTPELLDELVAITEGLTAQQLYTVTDQAQQLAEERYSMQVTSSNVSNTFIITKDDMRAALHTHTKQTIDNNKRKMLIRYYATGLNLSPKFLDQLAQDTAKYLSIEQLKTLVRQAQILSQERGNSCVTQTDMLVAKCRLAPDNYPLSAADRRALLDYYFLQASTSEGITVDTSTITNKLAFFIHLAKQTADFKAQDIKQLIDSAITIAQSKNNIYITAQDFWIAFYAQAPAFQQHPPLAIRQALLQYYAQQKNCSLTDSFFKELAEHTYHYTAGQLCSLVDKSYEITRTDGELSITQSAFYVALLDLCLTHNCISYTGPQADTICIPQNYTSTKKNKLAHEINKAFLKHILSPYQHTLSEKFIAKLAQIELMHAYGYLQINQGALGDYCNSLQDRRDQIRILIQEAQTRFAHLAGWRCMYYRTRHS